MDSNHVFTSPEQAQCRNGETARWQNGAAESDRNGRGSHPRYRSSNLRWLVLYVLYIYIYIHTVHVNASTTTTTTSTTTTTTTTSNNDNNNNDHNTYYYNNNDDNDYYY